jgi:hypothetical protein
MTSHKKVMSHINSNISHYNLNSNQNPNTPNINKKFKTNNFPKPTPQEYQKNLNINSIFSPNKRKHCQLEKSKEELSFQNNFIRNKINDIYEKFCNRMNSLEWKEEFIFELKQENILDLDNTFPKSLNTRGSQLLEYTRFWILFIELRYPDLDLLGIISIFNEALLYEQSDLNLLHEYLIILISENFDKKEIRDALEKINGKNNHFRVPSDTESLKEDHYKFLLDKPEIFNNTKFIQVSYKKLATPFSSKLKNSRSNQKSGYLDYNSLNKSSKNAQLVQQVTNFNVFEKENITSKTSNEKKISSIFELSPIDRKIKSIEKNWKDQLQQDNDEEKRISVGINTSSLKKSEAKIKESPHKNEAVDECKKNCYQSLIDRNKFLLEINFSAKFEIICSNFDDKLYKINSNSYRGNRKKNNGSKSDCITEHTNSEDGEDSISTNLENQDEICLISTKPVKNKKRGKSAKLKKVK